MRKMTLIGVLLLASAMECVALPPEDEATMRRIVRFLMPQCGGNRTTRVEYIPELIDVLNINGDTNRLARLLAELAQTNSAWYAKMAMWQLEKYGTEEQLPFLYSCATNPAVANRAVNAVLRIEGVTSNSVAMLQRFLYITNSTPSKLAYEKAIASSDFLSSIASSSPDMKECAILAVRDFVANVSTGVSRVDEALIAADVTYRYSKRRLSDLRCAYPRCFNEYQTNYVTNAINELVAYPEANLPD